MESDHYKLLDIIKLIAAYMVIGLHVRPLLAVSTIADHIYNSDIANYVVPFFYACTGFFLVKSDSKYESLQIKLKKKLAKTTKSYLLWTALYFPLTVYGWKIGGKSIGYNVLQFIRNVLFVGENYYSWTLWYLNGLIFALLLIYFGSKKHTIKQMFCGSILLYIIGLVLQTVNSQGQGTTYIISRAVRVYFTLFCSTRNGLFRLFAFIMVGMMIGERVQQGKLQINVLHKMLALAMYAFKIMLSAFWDGTIQDAVCQMLDLPTTYVLFALIIKQSSRICPINNKTALFIRSLSGNIYYVHMYFVALCALLLMGEDAYHNFFSFLIVSFFSTIVGTGMVFIKNRYCHTAAACKILS